VVYGREVEHQKNTQKLHFSEIFQPLSSLRYFLKKYKNFKNTKISPKIPPEKNDKKSLAPRVF